MTSPLVAQEAVKDSACKSIPTDSKDSGSQSPAFDLSINIKGVLGLVKPELEYVNKEHTAVTSVMEYAKCSSPTARSHQDSPIDFSIKRRTSFSGSLTDDSQASSSSPGHVTDYNPRSPSSDPVLADDTSGTPRWRTPSSDGCDEQMDREQTTTVLSPVPISGMFRNLATFPTNLFKHLTNSSTFKSLSQTSAVTFNDKHDKTHSSLLQKYPQEILQNPLACLGVVGPTATVGTKGIDFGLFMGANAKGMLHLYQQQLQHIRATEQSGQRHTPFSTQSSLSLPTGKHYQQQEPQRSYHYIHMPTAASGNNRSPHLNLSTSPNVGGSPALTDTALASTTSPVANSSTRKRPSSLPDDRKDDAYWERRRKNNDAAKRSRDARRAKEEEIAMRAALLEQENLRLRAEVASLRTETQRLRHMLYIS